MKQYLTTGQVASKLHVSVSTIKRWIAESYRDYNFVRNSNGWRLFTEEDVALFRNYKRVMKKNGKQFGSKTLAPAQTSGDVQSQTQEAALE